MRIKNGVQFAFAVAALVGALPVLAGERIPEVGVCPGYQFASSANVQGQHGAYFKTKMTLFNPNAEQITIVAGLQTPSGLFPPGGLPIVLPAGSFASDENFLQDVFGYTGGAGIGLVDSTCSHNFVAVGEVYVEGPNGRYSTPIAGLHAGIDQVAMSGSGSLSVSAGLTVTSSTRANFGCSSASSEQTTVHVVFAAFTNGVMTSSTADLVLGAYSWAQQPVPIQGTDILAFFSVTAGGGGGTPGGVFCYGVNVDNTSNDGTDIPAAFVVVAGHAITYAWGGPLAIARDWHPSVGLDRTTGIAWAGGYVGDGVATANLAGRTLSDLILGRTTDLTALAWVNHRSRRWEPEPLRWLGVNAGLHLVGTADREEARSGKPARRATTLARLLGY